MRQKQPVVSIYTNKKGNTSNESDQKKRQNEQNFSQDKHISVSHSNVDRRRIIQQPNEGTIWPINQQSVWPRIIAVEFRGGAYPEYHLFHNPVMWV